jgi:hypothetical protein
MSFFRLVTMKRLLTCLEACVLGQRASPKATWSVVTTMLVRSVCEVGIQLGCMTSQLCTRHNITINNDFLLVVVVVGYVYKYRSSPNVWHEPRA